MELEWYHWYLIGAGICFLIIYHACENAPINPNDYDEE